MAGGDALRAQGAGFIEEGAELDLAVAQHVGIGRAAGAVLGEEVLEHPRPVFAGEVARMEGNAEPAADGDRVAAVVFGATLARAVVVPVLHEQPGDAQAATLEQERGDGGIDPAGDADHGIESW